MSSGDLIWQQLRRLHFGHFEVVLGIEEVVVLA